ncbi:CvpA family protein [Chloroflexota bacterium]
MIWVSILAVLVLFFSFIGGLKEGAVKNSFSLLALIIAIPLTGASYHLLAAIFSFLPGEDWESFVGFFVTLALIIIILHLVFLLPRKFMQKAWNKGVFFRLIGGALNIFNPAIGMVVFTLLIRAYPIFGWLEQAVTDSSVLTWLVTHLSFVQAMLPEVFQDAATSVATGPTLSLMNKIIIFPT